MDRPCFLIVDREYPGNISTRKLVIETAKFNVITAYDPQEAIQSLKRFPNVDGVVVNAEMAEYNKCNELIEELRRIVPEINIIVTSTGEYARCDHSEYHVDSLDPKKLLDCLQSLKKGATAEVVARDPRIIR